MANLLIKQMLKGEGVEIHVAMDDKQAIYCEGKILATKLAEVFSDKFGIYFLVGKETEIPSKVNGLFKVFPITIADVKSNCLVIRTQDIVSALGIKEILNDSKVHHRGLKIMPISNGRRRSGRRSHSTTR